MFRCSRGGGANMEPTRRFAPTLPKREGEREVDSEFRHLDKAFKNLE